MSDPFSRIDNSLTTAGDAARNAAAEKSLELKQKAFEKKKTIEEGLSGFKAITGVRKIGKAAVDNLSPYVKQEAKASWNQFKDQWTKEIKSRAEGYVKQATSRATEDAPIQMSEIGEIAGDAAPSAAAAAAAPVEGASASAAPVEAVASQAAEPASDLIKLLPGEESEAAASKVGSTLNPFSLGGDGVNPAASASSSLSPIAEASGAEERAAQLGALRVQLRTGVDALKTQQAAINDSISRLGNAGRVATPGNSAADEAAAAAKAAETQAAQAAEKQAAEKAAAGAAEKTAAETGGEVTGEEAVGGFLDDTGILAPLGLLIGAIGLGTAAEEAKKKMPKFTPAMAMGDQVGGTSYQAGIN